MTFASERPRMLINQLCKTGKNQKAGLIRICRSRTPADGLQPDPEHDRGKRDRKDQPLSESAFLNRCRSVMTKALQESRLEGGFTEHDLQSKKPVVLRTLRPKASE